MSLALGPGQGECEGRAGLSASPKPYLLPGKG